MMKIEKSAEEIVIVHKNGSRTLMPNMWMAEQYAKSTWKGYVAKIEVKTTYEVSEEEMAERLIGVDIDGKLRRSNFY